jgi:asparagine synthase (glutamine-hydrolysing)
MRGICGWIGGHPELGRSESILADMMAGEFGNDRPPRQAMLADGSAIGVEQGLTPISTYRDDGLLVAMEGRVRWHSSELLTISARDGCAAALAEAYRRHGEECLRQIAGTFALAIVDAKTASGLVAVDRMGIFSLCYAQQRGRLVFGPNAASVAAHPDVGRTLSRQAIFDYLYCHVVPAPGTIYAGIHKLRPAECLVLRRGTVERRYYWQLRYHDHGEDSVNAQKARFRRLLREAARRAIGSDADIGAFLSGGTDSSTVAGLLTELRGRPAKTYSIGFSAEGFDEMRYARITARHFATDVVDAIPLIARAYDEPFGNDSAVPAYYCARMAHADGVQVLLAGDGGDEIFGGNARYAKQKLFEAYGAVPSAVRRGLIEPLALRMPGAGRIAPLRKLASYVRQASVPLPERLESYNFLHRSPLANVFEPAFLADVDPGQPLALQRDVYRRTASDSPVNRMMHLDLEFTLADNDLRKVTRMCELAGVEVRYPLLDDALVEFSGELPPSLKVKGLRLRYFFKQALRDVLPPETLKKTKHGFGMPFGLWLRDHKPLAGLVHESLDAFARRGILKPLYIKQLLHEHETSHATYFGIMIWVVMTLECWLAARKL